MAVETANAIPLCQQDLPSNQLLKGGHETCLSLKLK